MILAQTTFGSDLPDADDAFYRFVWGSSDAATEAIATCREYDRARLNIESISDRGTHQG